MELDYNILVEKCLNGHAHAQSHLYEAIAPKMMVVCMRYTRNIEDAEEIMHDGFLKIFKYLNTLNDPKSLVPWARKIMANCALDKIKKKDILKYSVSVDLIDSEFEYNEDVLSNLSSKEMLAYIQKLTPAYNIVFNLYYFEGYKHKEIAELLNINIGTSKSNLFEAKKMLRKMISEKNYITKFYE